MLLAKKVGPKLTESVEYLGQAKGQFKEGKPNPDIYQHQSKSMNARGGNRDRGLTVVNPYLPDFTALSLLLLLGWMPSCPPGTTWVTQPHIYGVALSSNLNFVMIEVSSERKLLAEMEITSSVLSSKMSRLAAIMMLGK